MDRDTQKARYSRVVFFSQPRDGDSWAEWNLAELARQVKGLGKGKYADRDKG